MAPRKQAAAYHESAADAVAELHREGALEKVVELPFGTFSGEAPREGALATGQGDLSKPIL